MADSTDDVYSSRAPWQINTAWPKAPSRSARHWQPITVVIQAFANVGRAVNLFSSRPGRASISIANIGSNPVTVSNTQQGAEQAQNSQTQFINIAAGGTLSIDTEDAVWFVSISGTTVECVETFNIPGEVQ